MHPSKSCSTFSRYVLFHFFYWLWLEWQCLRSSHLLKKTRQITESRVVRQGGKKRPKSSAKRQDNDQCFAGIATSINLKLAQRKFWKLLRKTRQIALCFDLLPLTFPLKLDPEQNAAVNKDDRLSTTTAFLAFLAFQLFFRDKKWPGNNKSMTFLFGLGRKQRKLYTLDVWNGIYTVGIYEFFFFFCYLKVDNGLT